MSDQELLKQAEEYYQKAYGAENPATSANALAVCSAASLLVIARNSIPVNVEQRIDLENMPMSPFTPMDIPPPTKPKV